LKKDEQIDIYKRYIILNQVSKNVKFTIKSESSLSKIKEKVKYNKEDIFYRFNNHNEICKNHKIYIKGNKIKSSETITEEEVNTFKKIKKKEIHEKKQFSEEINETERKEMMNKILKRLFLIKDERINIKRYILMKYRRIIKQKILMEKALMIQKF